MQFKDMNNQYTSHPGNHSLALMGTGTISDSHCNTGWDKAIRLLFIRSYLVITILYNSAGLPSYKTFHLLWVQKSVIQNYRINKTHSVLVISSHATSLRAHTAILNHLSSFYKWNTQGVMITQVSKVCNSRFICQFKSSSCNWNWRGMEVLENGH